MASTTSATPQPKHAWFGATDALVAANVIVSEMEKLLLLLL